MSKIALIRAYRYNIKPYLSITLALKMAVNEDMRHDK